MPPKDSLRSLPGNSRASTPKTKIFLLYCFVLSPTPLTLQGLSWAWQELFSSQLWEAWDVLNCLNTDSFEQLKDWLEIVLVKGFSLVGPMFAAKSPYPLPAVSLAVYWLIELVYHLSVNEHLSCFSFWLLWVMPLWTLVYKYFCVHWCTYMFKSLLLVVRSL